MSLLVVSCVRAPARFAEEQPRDVLYSGMVGKWSGTHVVAGSNPAFGRFTPTDLVVVPAPDRDGLELRYRQPGSTNAVQQSLGHWHFALALDTAQMGGADDRGEMAYRVVEQAGGRDGAPLQLVLESASTNQPQPKRIHQVIDVSTGFLRIRTDVQEADGDFTFREAYVFRRAE